MVPAASVLLINDPSVPKLMLLALTLQRLTTVAVAEVDVLAVLAPTGQATLPRLSY